MSRSVVKPHAIINLNYCSGHGMFAKARISVRESSRFMAKERILNLDNNGFSLDLRRKAMRCWTGSVTLIFRSPMSWAELYSGF